jgi:hypothetical protein
MIIKSNGMRMGEIPPIPPIMVDIDSCTNGSLGFETLANDPGGGVFLALHHM